LVRNSKTRRLAQHPSTTHTHAHTHNTQYAHTHNTQYAHIHTRTHTHGHTHAQSTHITENNVGLSRNESASSFESNPTVGALNVNAHHHVRPTQQRTPPRTTHASTHIRPAQQRTPPRTTHASTHIPRTTHDRSKMTNERLHHRHTPTHDTHRHTHTHTYTHKTAKMLLKEFPLSPSSSPRLVPLPSTLAREKRFSCLLGIVNVCLR